VLIPYFDVIGCAGIAQLEDGTYRLDFEDGSRLATPEELLHARREYYCAEVNRLRDVKEQSGFTYLGKVFDSDAVSVQRLSGAWCAARMAVDTGAEFSIEWTCADNTSIVLSATELMGILPALAAHVSLLHARARELKTLVRSSDAPEAIDIFYSWPE
jgi:hypothetical protein